MSSGAVVGDVPLQRQRGSLNALTRVAVIGDVHGCIDELTDLLARLAMGEHDRLIFLGDFMDKGPEPLACLRLAMQMCQGGRAAAVASNHEERHARWWRRVRSGKPNAMRPWHDPKDEEVNAQLTLEEVEWMEQRPPWAEIIPGWVAVHGGFTPGVPLAKQDPKKVIRMRWVDAVTGKHVPVDYDAAELKAGPPDGCIHWTDGWVKSAVGHPPESVVYGHEAFSLTYPRLCEDPSGAETWGIDTGCVHGGHLTALVFCVEGGLKLVQVKARRVYCKPPAEIPA